MHSYRVRQFENDVMNQAALRKYNIFRVPAPSDIVIAFPPEASNELKEVIEDQHLQAEHGFINIEYSESVSCSSSDVSDSYAESVTSVSSICTPSSCDFPVSRQICILS